MGGISFYAWLCFGVCVWVGIICVSCGFRLLVLVAGVVLICWNLDCEAGFVMMVLLNGWRILVF